MNMLKKIFAGLAISTAFVVSAQAGEINVGGVVFDPSYAAGDVDADFLGEFQFTQWYGTNTAKGTVNYGSATGINTVLGTLNGTNTSTGYFLQGVGVFGRINDTANSIGSGFGAAGSFCPGCQLTYAFGGIGLNKDSTFDLTNAWATMYVDTSTLYTQPATNQAEANKALDGTTWLDFNLASLGFAQGSTVRAGFVDAVLEIIGGVAKGNFDPTVLAYSASTQFRGDAKYSTGGNGQLIGNSIPEPGSIALLGLGLLGAAFIRRRQNQA